MFPIILAQDAPSPQEIEELWRLTQKSWEPRPYFTTLLDCGPLYLALHVFMLVTVIVAITLSWRGARFASTLIASTLPFVFGALSMWIAVLAMKARHSSRLSEPGNIVQVLSELPRPFHLGIILATGLLVTVTVIHRIRKPHNV